MDINGIRRRVINRNNQKRLTNHSFSLLCNNCNGAFICHDLNVKFNSPFVNLWVKPGHYLKYLKNMQYYHSLKLKFTEMSQYSYPVGILNDIEIYFQHYLSSEQAEEKWIQRVQRINYDNLFVLMVERDGCSVEQLKEFDQLPYEHKKVFTHLPHPEISSAVYIRGFETEEYVGDCFSYMNKLSGEKYYDQFDYIRWFNEK